MDSPPPAGADDDNPGRLYICQGSRSSVDIELDVVTAPSGNKDWIGWRVEKPDGNLVASSGPGSADPPESRFGPPPAPAANCSTIGATLTPSDTLREFHVKLFCDEEVPYCEKVDEPYMYDDKEISQSEVLIIIVYVLNVDLVIHNGLKGVSGGQEISEADEESKGAVTVANLNDTDGDGGGTTADKDDNVVSVSGSNPPGRNEHDLMELTLKKPQWWVVPCDASGD